MLAEVSVDQFAPHLNSRFRLQTGTQGPIEVEPDRSEGFGFCVGSSRRDAPA